MSVKGVVLAGGLGTRFHPVTKVTNKHLLDVFDEPMVFFPIRSLAAAGITEIVLVTGKEIDQFRSLLGTGSSLGVSLQYAQQDGEGGIADALAKAKPFVDGDRLAVILGDNIFQDDLTPFIRKFEKQPSGARLLLRKVSPQDALRFGVAEVSDNRIKRIIEKPTHPASDLVVTGCYLYDQHVFDYISTLRPSSRGELEITDVNNRYADEGSLEFDVLQGWWTDAGTPPSKLKASLLVALAKGVTFQP